MELPRAIVDCTEVHHKEQRHNNTNSFAVPWAR